MIWLMQLSVLQQNPFRPRTPRDFLHTSMDVQNTSGYFFYPLVATLFFITLQTLSPNKIHCSYPFEVSGYSGDELSFFCVVGTVLFRSVTNIKIGNSGLTLLANTYSSTSTKRWRLLPPPISISCRYLIFFFFHRAKLEVNQFHVSCDIQLSLLSNHQLLNLSLFRVRVFPFRNSAGEMKRW